MIRRPPRSTLFPTRRSSDLGVSPETLAAPGIRLRSAVALDHHGDTDGCLRVLRDLGAELGRYRAERRSEEHTSELQSRQYLVCRLLLEKKKNTTIIHTHTNQ